MLIELMLSVISKKNCNKFLLLAVKKIAYLPYKKQ